MSFILRGFLEPCPFMVMAENVAKAEMHRPLKAWAQNGALDAPTHIFHAPSLYNCSINFKAAK